MITDRETKITIREPRVMAVGVPLKIMSNSKDMITDRESKFTDREPRVMAVGVPLKIMSSGTSGTTGKI